MVWRWTGSNRRPSHCERDALPTELHPRGTGAVARYRPPWWAVNAAQTFEQASFPLDSATSMSTAASEDAEPGRSSRSWSMPSRPTPRSDAYRPLAEAYLGMGRFMEAMVVCKKGVKAHPNRADPRVLLARVYAEQGKDKKAIEELQARWASRPRTVAFSAPWPASSSAPATPWRGRPPWRRPGSSTRRMERRRPSSRSGSSSPRSRPRLPSRRPRRQVRCAALRRGWARCRPAARSRGPARR